MQAHLKTKEYLKSLESELTERWEKFSHFTSMREGIYSENFPMYTGSSDFLDSPDEIKIPHDGSGRPMIAFAKIENLGEAMVKLV